MFFFLIVLIIGIKARQPNVLFIVVDDVGWADVSYHGGHIATPHIDNLADSGVKLETMYVQSTCTPTRASIMTGRYPANFGLTFAMLPGALSGLPLNMATVPNLLKEHGYRRHMVGKWHVGASSWAQTPVGRGFESHVGSYLWSSSHNEKELFAEPWNHFAIDWVRAYENGTYEHSVEPRHSTDAIKEEAIRVMERHDATTGPLFLYTAFQAAHSPLEPKEIPSQCQTLAHLWRRQFCGLMVHLDQAVGELAQHARDLLGEDTVLVFTSDNGGQQWYGGMNTPLRSGKTSPFEGGVRVPSFVVDFSSDGRFFGPGGREFRGIAHCSDWLPTLASLAGASKEEIGELNLDGFDLGPTLRSESIAEPRESVLIEMYYGSRGEHMFPEDIVAFRKGDFKLLLLDGVRDANWYTEPLESDRLNSSDTSLVTRLGESALRFLESFTTPGKFDSTRDALLHILIHGWFRAFPPPDVESEMLFNVVDDVEERHNIASEHPDLVAEMKADIEKIRLARPEQQKFWMTLDRDSGELEKTLVSGNCTGVNVTRCLFVHPFVPEDADPSTIPLVYGASAWPFIRNVLVKAIKVFGPPLLIGILIVRVIFQSFKK